MRCRGAWQSLGVLLNPKLELFARGLAEGKSQAVAYKDAGYSGHTGAASAYAKKPNIIARVSELIEKKNNVEEVSTANALERNSVTKTRLVAELAIIGFARMDTFVSVTSGGDPFIDLSAVPKDEWAAIKEIVVDEYTEGRGDDARDIKRTRITLHDKRGALMDLARMAGMVTPNQNNTQVNIVFSEKDAML